METKVGLAGGEGLPTAVWSYWKEFDLDTLRGKLDEQGLAIAESQEASVKNRRKLAESTKDFRRKAGSEVAKEVAGLLKAYQEEVDRLTQRAKYAEGAFLGVYQKLYDAPDPAPTLSTALELGSRSAELEAQSAKLAGELAEYKAESKELKNQDLTIRKLEERVRGLEAQLEEKERQLDESKQEAEAELAERSALEAREREDRLAEELSQAHTSMEALKRLYNTTQSQLFSMQSRSEEERQGAQSELEYALAEMERAQARLVTLEREKEALLVKVQQAAATEHQQLAPAAAAAAAAGGGRGEGEWEALRQELYAHRELAGRLNAEVAALRQQQEAEGATWGARCEALRSALEAKEAHCSALEAELATRPMQKQVDELRQQVRILQAVGYNAVEDTGEAPPVAGSGNRDGAEGSAVRYGSLEVALLEKNRRLEHQLTMVRLQLAEAQGEAEASAAKLAELGAELAQQRELVARLEEDLLAAERAAGARSAAGEAAEGGTISPTASGMLQEAPGGDGAGEGPSMLSVLCHQRDRFRARVRELEDSLVAVQQELARVRTDAEAARADNIALVERLRFVQGYAGSEGAAARRASSAAADLEAGGVVGKYMREYEKSVNPFTDWKAREREARRRQLGLPDRAMYAFGSLISGNKAARSAIFFYALALHAIVFLVLARYSHHSTDQLEGAEALCAKLAGHAGGSGDLLPGATFDLVAAAAAVQNSTTAAGAAASNATLAAATAAGRLLRRFML
ncbi:hypothetical protein N2152v2_005498 [Parachlorella kessleri]